MYLPDYQHLIAAYGASGILTFGAYGYDKIASKRGWRRVPEKTLLVLGLLGGWPGAILGQNALRHKNRKVSFQLLFWLSVAGNLLVLSALFTVSGH